MTSASTRETDDLPAGHPRLERMPTGIPGFDEISHGGLPLGRASLVLGTSGSCKTLFACQCIVLGIKRFKRNAVLVSFEETAESIRANVASLGWDFETEIDAGNLLVLDCVPGSLRGDETGKFELGGLLQQIYHGIEQVGAELVVLDAFGTLFAQIKDEYMIRREFFRISEALGARGGHRHHDR